MKVRNVAAYACATGENPLWHPTEKKIYWTDIPKGRLYRYDPATDTAEQCYEGRPVGGFTLQADGSLLLFRDKGNVVTFRDGQVGRTLVESLPEEEQSRFNDVIADAEGRVYCGTMPTPTRPGRLYRLDPDLSIHIIVEDVGCSNGMGFTLDGEQMFYIDTPTYTVWQFEYERGTGELTNRRQFISIDEAEGGPPDGMTVDAQGGLWVALWGGSGVLHFDSAGRRIEKLSVPSKRVTSVTFAGDTLEDLYITSAVGGKPEPEDVEAGSLFHARPGVKGRAEFVSRTGM